MKLKHLATIDWIVSTVFVIMMVPFWVPAYALQLLKKPFAWVLAWGEVLHHRICNWLARQADEVKDGRICNPHHLRNCTAKQLYNLYHFNRTDYEPNIPHRRQGTSEGR